MSGSSDKTVMLVLSYLGIFCLIPLLVEKDDEEVQWHAKNGLMMCVAWFVLYIPLFILSWIPIIQIIALPVWCLFGIGVLVVHIVAMVKATQGERWRLPVITDYAEKI